jgi:catechol 2,3-dioxygenase-like lactoylglutathione lyase family enzyme
MRPFARITSRQNVRLFDHVTIRVSNLDASRRFYSLALGEPTHDGNEFLEWGDFGIAAARPDRPLTRGLHIGFAAGDRPDVDRWWERLTAAGYTSDGDPGERPEYHESYYGAFVLDPDGNNAESVHHWRTKPGAAVIDHLWLRTPNVSAAKAFYETVAPVVGIQLVHDAAENVRFTDGVGSFSFVIGEEPTANVHLAFGVQTVEAVGEFHRVGAAAGYRSNGGPGERPEYRAGYHGAFLLDPDGNNVEAVCHKRP